MKISNSFVLLIGALISLVIVLAKGHNNNSWLLLGMFTVWVSLPFVALQFLLKKSQMPSRWASSLLLALTIFTVVVYTLSYFLREKTPAAPFLITPFVSLLLLFIIFLVTRKAR